MFKRLLLTMLCGALLACSNAAFALRCQGKIIDKGMHYSQVVKYCYKPSEESQETIDICTNSIGYYGTTSQSICHKVLQQTIIYRAVGQITSHILIFEDGILTHMATERQ